MATRTSAARDRSAGRFERFAPLAGIGFALTAAAGVILMGENAAPFEPADQVAKAFLDDGDQILAGAQFLAIAAFLLVWFGASVRSALIRDDSANERLATMAFGGSVVAATCLLLAAFSQAAGALRAEEDDAIDAATAAMHSDLWGVFAFGAAPVGMALLVAATAAVVLRSDVALPQWLGYVSAVLGLALALVFINFIIAPLFLLWAIVVSLLLYRNDARRTA